MADTPIRDPGSERASIDIAAGLVLAAISVVCLAWVIPNHVGIGISEHDISPAFFPRLTAWLVLGLSLGLVATRARRIDWRQGPLGGLSAGRSIVFETVVWAAVAALAWFAMTAVGYVPTAAALVLFGALACRYRYWPAVIGLAVLLPLAVDRLAWLVFQVELP